MASENSKVLSHVLVTGSAGFIGRTLDIVSAPVATGDVRHTTADTSAASADLDWA